MNRESSPKAAFAYITSIRGGEWKLLRHHHLDAVRDGTEHDTVDHTLLAMALRMVDQLPASDEDKEAVREHLQAHAEAIRATMDEDRARSLVESHNDGAPDGNHTITDPKVDIEYPNVDDSIVNKQSGESKAANVAETTPDDAIVAPSADKQSGGPSEKTVPGKDNSPSSPKGDVESEKDIGVTDDVEKKGGKGTPAHPPKVSETPADTAVPGIHDGDTVDVGRKGDTQAGAAKKGTPTAPGKDNSPEGAKPDQKIVKDVSPKGDVETKTGDGKNPDKPKVSETDEGKGAPPAVDKNEDVIITNTGKSASDSKKKEECAEKPMDEEEPKDKKAPKNGKKDQKGKKAQKKTAKKGCDKTEGECGPEKTEAAKWTTKFINNLPDSSFAVVEKGGKKDKSGKTTPRNYRHLPYKDSAGKVDLPHLRNALARMNQIQAVSPSDSSERIRKVARRVLVNAAKKAGVETKEKSKAAVGDWVRSADGVVGVVTYVDDNGKATVRVPSGRKTTAGGWKIIVCANEVNSNDPADLLQKEMRILNSHEALVQFATPTPEGQRARKSAIALASVSDLTEEGRKLVTDRFMDAVHGKAVAKILGVEKLGSVEFVDLKVGEKEEFPFYVMMEVHRDGDNKVRSIRILNERLPSELFNDLAKFLKELAKEMPEKAKAGAKPDNVKKAEAPAKLERCVSDVLAKKVADFKKRNKRAPTAKERKKMESSAYAICNAQLKKG